MNYPVILATLVLLIVFLVVFFKMRPIAPTGAGFDDKTIPALGIATGATLLVGATILGGAKVVSWLRRNSPSAVGGGAEIVTFRGDEVNEDLVPFLHKLVKKSPPLPRVASDLPVGPPYVSSAYKVETRLHYGQRKLLIAEVGFLTRYGSKASHVVYVGAAPGTHIPMLARLFPNHTFELYDREKFHLSKAYPETLKNIAVHRRFFEQGDAERLKGKKILLISDIRTGMTDKEAGERVPLDMKMQAEWVKTMRPAASQLKFRLPWAGGKTRYFKGEARLQAWAPLASTESRLEFEGVPPLKSWDNAKYDQRLQYLNKVVRSWAFFSKPKGLPDVKGVDHCFSCSLERATWEEYIAHKGSLPGVSVGSLMNEATRVLKQRLDVPPHGVDPDVPMAEKRADLIKRCESGEFPCFPQKKVVKRRAREFLRRRKGRGARKNDRLK
jgi:hypothetical protein